jgi:hypothetical protein
MTAVLNQGCKLEINGPLSNDPLLCTAQLVDVQQEETKIRLTTRVATRNQGANAATPDAVVASVYAVIPQKRKKVKEEDTTAGEAATAKPKRPKMVLPAGATMISEHELSASAGLHYAYVSGDFNPIHCISPYAKAAGFPSVILHGFAQVKKASTQTHTYSSKESKHTKTHIL